MSAVEVIALDTANLGDRSYVVGCDGAAVVIDPQRDIDRVQQVLDERGWVPSHVLETHFHNDYVSGGLQLAKVLGAEYVVPDGMDIAFAAHRVQDQDSLATGIGTLRVLHTPGHTPNHVSYVLADGASDLAVFTGGSMLFGSVGRPDLLGPSMTEPLAKAQWESMRRIAAQVNGAAQVYPTHGFGSFCSATATVGNASTVAEQIASNSVFALDQAEYVADLIAGLDAYPAYYAHMGPANQAGAGPVDLSLPQLASADEIARRIAAGEWVVDLRHRRVFSAEHVRGTLSFDVHGNAVTYLGWLIAWGTPLTLLGADVDEVQAMQRELVRIGIDRPVAYATGSAAQWATADSPVSGYRRATHVDMAAALIQDPQLAMLDLRRHSEFESGYVRGAKHLPLHELQGRMGELRAWDKAVGKPVWIYCGSGFRASIGASLLEAAGIEPVHVDDDFANAAKAGLVIDVPDHQDRLGGAYLD
jgi:hydroxyacylglutathione hydrolase